MDFGNRILLKLGAMTYMDVEAIESRLSYPCSIYSTLGEKVIARSKN